MSDPEPVYYSTTDTPDGDQEAKVRLTPTDDQRDKVILAKPFVIPVLFIPGIMGTNLKKEDGTVAWQPPNLDLRGTVDAIGQLFEYLFKSTKQRASELNTDEARVDSRGPIDDGKSGLPKNVLRARNWGTVMRSSYHPLMGKLQFHLNKLSKFNPDTCEPEFQEWAAKEGKEAPTEWGAESGAALTADEILHAAEYQFDVWGGGYKWLQSNRLSGADIQDYIERTILPYYNDGKKVEVMNSDDRPCKIQRARPVRPLAEKVIIVTHSMGGLVSRSLTEIHHCEKVLGVSHGVQPSTGAPDTYKRMRAGSDGVAQLFLGRNAADLTAIMTQAQGGMELLPMADYNDGKPWLRVRDKAVPEEEDSGPGMSLPKADPYEEIYKSPKWYGLVPTENEGLMNPAGGEGEKSEVPSRPEDEGPRKVLNDLINSVKKFHTEIQGKYKSPTYVHYGHQGQRTDSRFGEGFLWTGLGADKDRFASGQVVWEGDGGSLVEPDAVLHSDDQNGKIELANSVKLRIAKADAPGDGTVPWQSGAAPKGKAGVEMVFTHGQGRSGNRNEESGDEHQNSQDSGNADARPPRHNEKFGYEHQNSYNDERALYATLYAIVKIAQNARWHEGKEASE